MFKAFARQRAGLHAPPERRASVLLLTVEEELRPLDQAWRPGRTHRADAANLLETRPVLPSWSSSVEDVSLAGRVITIRRGKGSKHREVPIRRELAQLLRLHIGTPGGAVVRQPAGSGSIPYMLTRQRVGQVVREVACAARITKRVYPHLLRHTVAARACWRSGWTSRPTAFPRP